MYICLCFKYTFTFVYTEEFQKGQVFMFLFFPLLLEEDFQPLKESKLNFQLLMHKKRNTY